MYGKLHLFLEEQENHGKASEEEEDEREVNYILFSAQMVKY